MSRRSSNLEFSIRGDELEQHRIQLEHNLQHTDLSFHLSSIPGDDCSDVEYPRHHSAPSPFSAFASFEQRSGDQFDLDEQSQHHAWSYRSLNDDDAIHPFAGETLSTAAHHASALTFSAGLDGRATRRDVSLSGAEYDPDRPLQGIMAGINSRFSGLDTDSTNPRHIISKTVDFDPLVVDNTAELDRVLQSGHAAGLNIRSPVTSGPSSSSGSEPGSPNPTSFRPTLSDALNKAAFSPKRPRSALSPLSPPSRAPAPFPSSSMFNGNPPQRHPRPSSPFARSHHDISTPKSRQTARLNQSLSYVQQQSLPPAALDPEVRVHPPTPSLVNSSKFTRMARGLARELEVEQSRWGDHRDAGSSKPAPAQSTINGSRGVKHAKERNPFKNIGNQVPTSSDPAPTSARDSRTPYKARVHLPDVTGLTSAVESPAKAGLEYYGYDGKFNTEARVLATLNTVQSKLAYLEAENSISRRRVRELELELESCKHEVARERTKVLERDGSMSRAPVRDEASFVNGARHEKGKVKGKRIVEVGVRPQAADDCRYKEAVQEKKALEALISTLRTHLSRLTAELSDHQRLLEDLRSLRDSDARALSEKGKDVDNLRREVERLAGEVEVLRGVVEEGLKERRVAREQLSRELSHLTDREDSENERTVEQDDEVLPAGRTVDTSRNGVFLERDHSDSESSDEGGNSTTSSARSPTPSPRRRAGLDDRTVRTDHATLGSSLAAGGMSTKAFIDNDELQRISAEVEERRSNPRSREENGGTPLSRPTAPTPAHALGKGHPSNGGNATARRTQSETGESSPVETPFPHIRGAQLERLFFSAPEHNAQTCTVCHRRRRHNRHSGEGMQQTPFWLAGRRNVRVQVQDHEDDEGFVSGQEDQPPYRGKGKAREHDRRKGGGPDEDKAPPQTVLARVLRELEDDFTHYKSIYVELADQYKAMDAVSNVVKRNVLAEHLREVIDLLEQKGDQIASLYDLLTFHDKL